MIAADKRKAVYLLHQEGMSSREIARRLSLDRKTVEVIIKQEGKLPEVVRPEKTPLDVDLLKDLYQECDGWVQRVYEKLTEEKGIDIRYSTLTRRLRKLGISQPQKTRCHHVPDEPGAEMQHDTTVYRIKVGERKMKLVASMIYLRYCKRRYLKFYRSFNRFKMKCFFHEALMFWGYCAPNCIIDNTNLARWRGTGSRAIMTREMEAFGKQYGFKFFCHGLGHSNRKAGEERSFWTVETNFFPGRTYQSLEDLNEQALQWSTVRMDQRPQGKAALVPLKAFEFECDCLQKLPTHLPAPYQSFGRSIDQYGYCAFDSNYYWVPGTEREDVQVLEFSQHLQIWRNREFLIEYQLPPQVIRNKSFSPPGCPAPAQQPRNRKRPAAQEQARLRALGAAANDYVDFIMRQKGLQRHEFVRKLFALSRRMTPELFLKSVARALRYQISCIATIQSIATLYMQLQDIELPIVEVDEHLQARETYQEGALSDQPDLSIYDKLLEPDDE